MTNSNSGFHLSGQVDQTMPAKINAALSNNRATFFFYYPSVRFWYRTQLGYSLLHNINKLANLITTNETGEHKNK